jgi:hypothetical protein
MSEKNYGHIMSYLCMIDNLITAIPLPFMQNTVCEVCGDIGVKHLLLCCRDCKCSAAHQYVFSSH